MMKYSEMWLIQFYAVSTELLWLMDKLAPAKHSLCKVSDILCVWACLYCSALCWKKSIFDFFWIKHFISLCTPKVSTVLNFSLVVYDVKLHYCNMYHGLFMVALVKTFAHFQPLALYLILADAYAADWSMDSHKLCWFMCLCFISSFLTTSLATLDQDLSLRIEVVFPNGMRI